MKQEKTETKGSNNFFLNEFKTSIVVALDNIGSANLSQLSKLIGRTKSTLHSHVRDLLTEGIIKLDVEMSQDGWGKFYTLSKTASKLLSDLKYRFYENAEVVQHLEDRAAYAKAVRNRIEKTSVLSAEQLKSQMLFYAKYFLNIVEMASNTSTTIQQLFKDGVEFPDDLIYLGSFDNALVSLPLGNLDHLKQYKAKFNSFLNDLNELAVEFQAENNDQGLKPDIQIVYLGGCPVNFTLEDI